MQSLFAGTSPSKNEVDAALNLLRAENRILELVARGAPLPEILETIARAAEQFASENVLCSILLLEERTGRLLHGAAPSLPASYNQAIHGVQIGQDVGTCGKAAFLNQIIETPDISSDPAWVPFRELALSHGLRAAFSLPIVSSAGKVLGTLGIYFREPATAGEHTRETVQLLGRTAAIAIERKQAERDNALFQQQIENLYRTGLALAGERDLKKIVQEATDAARELCGAQFGAFFYNVIDARGESYMLYTLSGVDPAKFANFPMPRNTEVFAPTFNGEGVVRSGNIRKDPRYGKNAPRKGMPDGHVPVTSYLAVPVVSRTGAVLGGLFFGHSEPDVFDEKAERLVSSVAAQAAVAIDNSQLHDSLVRQLQVHEEIQQRLNIAQRTARLATWEWDMRTDRIHFTPGAAEIFARGLSEMTKVQDWLEQIHPSDRPEIESKLRVSREQGLDYTSEYRVMRDDGQFHWIHGRGHVILDESGQPLRLVGISMDITERKKSEHALRQTEKLAATGRLAATIAHEINNPLEAVTNYIYLAKSDPQLPHHVKLQLEVADQELGRITHIAQQTLGFYRDTSGPVEVNVSDSLSNILKLYERRMSYRNLTVQRDESPGLFVRALQGELRQVLSNLVANAIDASEDGGTIRVRARKTSHNNQGHAFIRFTVADFGHGIPAPARHKIFSPFFTTKAEVGTGLGLWVTKGLVEKHGGSIRFRSAQGQRSGTVFSVSLPADGSGLENFRR
jgi:PAS domain S-box-containing protein